ncbi:ADP-ribose pyrophosphatase [Rhizobium sp. Leaf384]|uniref:NUDIX hydrolase n=1 Tax=unclassified Rhizobium TaxID=2613769 RepID=UPI0007123E5E|nr:MULTISPECIES: NUDIX domain-containing protein [unclassified Rhizobium]KQR73501.1 ADP-ribose pyrophosphatase [Rhizobium sp. Leaf341]KQS81505.1 ADP-ribose pyrophosphatase [Rhizobium sp. Leaf384]KQS86629.1 ADP-ribose pyrophosphatase [Rhizobium sp. Leaf383]
MTASLSPAPPPSPALASSAIVVRAGRYLLVRRSKPPSADMYAFPGGRSEPGETPAETAIRELLEETGIVGSAPQLFATYDLPAAKADGAGGRHFFLSVFRVEAEVDAEAVAGDDAASLGWYTADEIADLPAPPSVRDCIARLEALRAS